MSINAAANCLTDFLSESMAVKSATPRYAKSTQMALWEVDNLRVTMCPPSVRQVPLWVKITMAPHL